MSCQRCCLNLLVTLLLLAALVNIACGAEEPPAPAPAPVIPAPAAPAPAEPPAPVPVPPKAESGKYYRIDPQHLAYYETPSLLDPVTHIPGSIYTWLDESFSRENALNIAGLVVVTAGLIAADQDLVNFAQDTGTNLNISKSNHMKKVSSGLPIEYPSDVGSAFYYLGDGMIPISITAGMAGYGLYNSDPRSLQTASQLAEGLMTTTIVVQLLKHTTGRQSPATATERGGVWHLLPNQKDYFGHVQAYDAFPSGHLATSMMTVTVLAENYPDYPLIRPIGYGLMTLLGFQMMNNGVHWAGDYPLALAIGYGLGKVAVAHGRKVVNDPEHPASAGKVELTLLPLPVDNGAGLCLMGRF